MMAVEGYEPVRVSRRIAAPAADIFRILVDPGRHTDVDGSGMLRGAVSDRAVGAVGDVFVMRMYYSVYGDYEMVNHVVEYEQDRCVGWEPESGRGHPDTEPGSPGPTRWGHRWTYELTPDGPDATVVTEVYDCSRIPEDEQASMDGGRTWAGAMAETLRRLDALCAAPRSTSADRTLGVDDGATDIMHDTVPRPTIGAPRLDARAGVTPGDVG